MTTDFAELRLEGVGRSFAGHDALRDLDLTIRRGEFIALLGPSGCGKSTALNCLAGLLPLTAGRIWQDDTRVDTLPPERRGFGMVFQSYALFPHLTVRGNVAFGLQMRRLPKAEVVRRTEEAIRLVRLEDHIGKLPGQLSGGQQQRVAIARAIVLEPSLVLMDEPLSNLDAKLRLEMRTEIRRLHQSLGLTTVYVTHDQEEALSMADRLVVLRQGRVQQVGTPEELHTAPVNWHVADFMGFRNLFPMSVSADPTGNRVTVEGSGMRLLASPVGDLRRGQDVVVAVRPDDLQLTPTEGRADGDNVLPVTVEVVEYQGRELAVEVVTEQDRRLHVRTAERVAPGDRVQVSVAPERLLAFSADAPGPQPDSDTEPSESGTDAGDERAPVMSSTAGDRE